MFTQINGRAAMWDFKNERWVDFYASVELSFTFDYNV